MGRGPTQHGFDRGQKLALMVRLGHVVIGGELEYGRRIVFFRWTGVDEGDEISGNGSAELQDDGSMEIDLSFDNGDDTIIIAHRE